MSSVSTATREQVRQRAGGRCEYCRLPDDILSINHQIDHIRPIKLQGSDHIDNLAWACFNCNNRKGSNIAGYDPMTDEITPLYNPRSQEWVEHFEMDGSQIVGITMQGRTTADVLQINSTQQIEIRKRLVALQLW